jgi:transposase
VVALLEPFAAEVVVSNPMRTRAIAKIKTDRIDAAVLAHLLRLGYLPQVWHPDPETQALCRRTTERANLVADRTRIKNRVHAVLHQRLLEAPPGDLLSPRHREWLASLPLDAEGRESLNRHLRQLDAIEAELALLNQQLAVQAQERPTVRLLMTLPGVDVAVAETVLAVLGPVDRFPSADEAAGYLGLAPSTYQSAHRCYHGPITKQGSGHARWMLFQAAQHLAEHPGPLGVFFRRLARKKNRNVAVVAAARKLATIAWHMLKNNEPYRYAQPRATQAKLSRLRIRATGSRKKGGFAKGHSPSGRLRLRPGHSCNSRPGCPLRRRATAAAGAAAAGRAEDAGPLPDQRLRPQCPPAASGSQKQPSGAEERVKLVNTATTGLAPHLASTRAFIPHMGAKPSSAPAPRAKLRS